MSDLDLIGLLARSTAQGPGIEDDTALTATGTVLAVDPPGRRVRVALRGGDVWLPAAAARYKPAGTVRVLLDPTAGRPVLVLAAVDVRSPALLSKVISGPTGGILTVDVEGVSYALPAPMGAYTVGASAWVLTDDWGIPVIVHGPSSDVAPGGTTNPGGGGSTVITATALVGPQSTGTYRATHGWNAWGGSTGWGLADIYQGNGYGSGPLVGLACYGDQIVNLAAIEIQKATLTAFRNSSGVGGALTVQGSPHGSRPAGAPSSSGTTVTAPVVGSGEAAMVELPSDVREALRTGAAKGLAAVGAAYAGFGGTTKPGSFTLTIQYTRNA